MNKGIFNDYIKPVIVLVTICLVVTLALAFTYGMTRPVIEEKAREDADAARAKLLPEADGFREVKGRYASSKDGKAEVTEHYEATNGAGDVMTVETKSFGGKLVMMVGTDDNGEVTGIVITEHEDTPGVGTKDMTEEYLGQYKGLTDIQESNIKEDGKVDYISGASVTGQAIHSGVEACIAQLAIGGEK